jgi:hypothetical protein
MDNVKTSNMSMFIGVLVCGLLLGRAPLHAQSASAPTVVGGDDKPWSRGIPVERREAARALFLEGNRLFKVPLFSKATEKYTAALAAWKHPAFYFNLALAQLNLGQDVEARDNLEQALKQGEEPLGTEQFNEAKKQLQEVEGHLGRLRVSCQTQGAEVTLDGATLFTAPGSYEGWTKAKPHEITAKGAGYLSEAKRVMVAAGQLQDLELKLVTLSEAADTGRRWAVWKPWTVIVAGAAVAAGGGVVHALSSQNFNTYDDKFRALPCANTGGCQPSEIGSDLNSRLALARREQQIAIGGYIAGGALIGAGIVLLYMNRPRLTEQEAARSSTSVTVVPAVSPDVLGILVSVSH